MPPARVAGQFLLFAGIILFSLSSVTAPLIPELNFLKGSFAQDVILRIGMWGGCVDVGLTRTCPSPQFGFLVSLANFPNKSASGPMPIVAALTYTLVLLPISAFFALLSLLVSFLARRRIASVISIGFAGLALICSTTGVVCMLLLFVRAMQRINAQFPDSPASLGPATWFAVGGEVAFLIAMLAFVFGRRTTQNPKQAIQLDSHPMYEGSETTGIDKDPLAHRHSDPFMVAYQGNYGQPTYDDRFDTGHTGRSTAESVGRNDRLPNFTFEHNQQSRPSYPSDAFYPAGSKGDRYAESRYTEYEESQPRDSKYAY